MANWPKNGDYASARAFRAAKRRDVRNALKAMDELRVGCAFLPPGAYMNVLAADKLLEDVKAMLSVKRWKR